MVELLFFVLGVIIFVGFFSLRFFEETGIPDVIFLMLVGALLGATFVVDKTFFNEMTPYFGALALIMILFEGGLHLNISKVLNELYTASSFTITAFALSAFVVMNSVHYIFGWEYSHALLLGTVLGGTSSAVVIMLISRIRGLSQDTKTILSLESAITDALCILVTLTTVQVLMFQSASVQELSGDLIGAFSIAIVLGVFFSLAWGGMFLKHFHGRSFAYLLTIGVIFIMYSTTEFLKGNGAIAVLTFGLVLGNYSSIAKAFRVEHNISLEGIIKQFHSEISLLIRTFFFIYLGLIFNWRDLSVQIVMISVTVLAVLMLVRIAVVKLLINKDKSLKNYEVVLTSMMPRGLAAAVLASAPLSAGLIIPSIQEIVTLTIISTTVVATLGSYMYTRAAGTPAANGSRKPAN